MTVRFRLALTILLTGLATALGVIVTVAIAFERFEHQSTWQQANAFLGRVVAMHGDLLEQQQRQPEALGQFLRNLLLYEPDSQLYLLAMDGSVLASTGHARLPPGFKVAIAPVRDAVATAARGDARQAAYVMGDDPEFMEAGAVIAARPLHRDGVAPTGAVAGYLYLVCHRPGLPGSRLDLLASSIVGPALGSVLGLIVLATALAAWIIGTVTRPLRVLSDEVAAAARAGFSAEAQAAPVPAPVPGLAEPAEGPAPADDEFGRLRQGFRALLATLRLQWDELRRLDRFRRESVSNLSHDLRSPLTATVACLETLEQRWQAASDQGETTDRSDRSEERRLVEVALRNTRNAAGMVRSLGDLALLDEPEFRLKPMRLDLAEVMADIALRFADRAARQGVTLQFRQRGEAPPVAWVDVELFERAVANLLDNALKFTPAGGSITLAAEGRREGGEQRVLISVDDQGAGIPAADLPHLFDRLWRSRASVAPATSEEGRGLGLAIVKRIAELHRGRVAVHSELGRGTVVTLDLPAG